MPVPADAQTSSALSAADSAKIVRIFSTVAAPDAPGCAVGVARAGETVYARGFGGAALEQRMAMSPASAMNIGSIAKQFTAMATLLLVREGVLDLDARIEHYVREWPESAGRIRVRDLLYHTSGLRDYGTLETLAHRPVRTMPDFLGLMMRQRGLNFAPGTKQEYSHSDYSLLAIVIERATGRGFADVLGQLVFTPLGMTATTVHDERRLLVPDRAFAYDVDPARSRSRFPQDELVGGSNVYTTVEDLIKWDRNFVTGEVGGTDLVRRFTALQELAVPRPMPYVHGIWLGEHRGQRTISRRGGGGGFSTSFYRLPDVPMTVVTLCNTPHHQAETFSRAVVDAVLGDKLGPVPVLDTIATPPTEAARFAGVYRSAEQPWNPVVIEVRDGQLVEVLPDGVLFPLTRLRDGRYIAAEYTYAFRPTANGGMRITLRWPEGSEELERRVDTAWRPAAALLPTYAGVYASAELDALWTVRVAGTQLMLHRSGARPVPLQPIGVDQFAARSGTEDDFMLGVTFTRTKDNQIDGFTTGTTPKSFESALGLRFTKLDRPIR